MSVHYNRVLPVDVSVFGLCVFVGRASGKYVCQINSIEYTMLGRINFIREL